MFLEATIAPYLWKLKFNTNNANNYCQIRRFCSCLHCFLQKKFLAFMDKRGSATTRFFAQINELSRRLKTLEHGWEFLLIIAFERALFCVMQRDFIREF